MIEPDQADRLGICASFRPGDRHAVAMVVAQMRAWGIRHLRLRIDRDDLICEDRGASWIGWLLDAFGSVAEILLSPDASMMSDEFGHELGRVLSASPGLVASIEWQVDTVSDVHGLSGSLQKFASVAHQHRVGVVVSVHTHGLADRVAALHAAGALNNVHALGIIGDVGDAGVASHVGTARSTLDTLPAGLPLWATSIGCRAARHDIAGPVTAFADALATDLDRVYWTAVDDQTGAACALLDASAHPTLLGRLLTGGVGNVDCVSALSRASRTSPGLRARPILVTGGAGFIGANLVDRLAREGHQVLIYDALARPGVERNLHWLVRRHPTRVSFALGDLRDEPALSEAAAGASAVFHLAGQVAVTTSMVQPLADFDVNARGTLALLEALRCRNPSAPLVFASTNKVYGDLADIELERDGDRYLPVQAALRHRGVSETRPLCFHTPYGCSKGAADQYVLDYAHSFGLRTAVLRMSCIYGERQLGTEDQGWVAHFLLRAIAGEPVTIYGDGRQVRDILHVGDAVGAYLAAWRRIDGISGRAYNLGGGPANAISLLQLVDHIENLLGRQVDVEFSTWRPGDQRYFVADNTAINSDLSLPQALGWHDGLGRLAEHFGAPVARTRAEAAIL